MPRTVFAMPRDLEVLLRMPVYPGMIAAESRPLREFLRRHGEAFAEVRFNVRLGAGVQLGADAEPALRRAWEQLTKLRCDALGWVPPNEATLIECKESLSNDGVWQLLDYRDHYREEFPLHQLRLVAVAEYATPAAAAIASKNGIVLYLYAFPPGQVDINAPATETTSDDV